MRDALESVASNFPNRPTVSGDEHSGFEFAWRNGTISAGLRSYGQYVVVFLAEAQVEVTTTSAAIELLRGIFGDQFVAVAAFKNKTLVRSCIAPANDIGAGLNNPTHTHLGPVATAIDEVRVRSWSGALDAG